MKTYWVLGIIALLFLAACAPQAMPEKEEKETLVPSEEKAPVSEPVTEPVKEPEIGRQPPARALPSERTTAPPPSEVIVEQKVTISPALRDLLKRADEKISSLKYLYGGTDTKNLFLDTYHIKGTKMKIKKYEEDYYVREGYYDTIYVDRGIACCEERARCKSANIDNTGKKFDIDTSLLKIAKTPYQWVKEVPADAKIIGPQTVNSRSVTFVTYNLPDGAEVQMWIDDTYGVPHKVIVVKGDTQIKHQFNDMTFNSLKDSDFVPPCA
ncbi:MAG: hypothetical protein QW165_02730 [Candidatus Woesearchaeota archaeon]